MQASELIEAGFSIFPLRPNVKVGYYKDVSWIRTTTNDATLAKGWYSGIIQGTKDDGTPVSFEGCNWGINCGPSNICVVDYDVKDGALGRETKAVMDKEYGPANPGFVVATKSGGVHHYFVGKCKSNNNFLGTRDNKSGVDLKSDGSMVMAPGSIIKGDADAYKIIKGSSADMTATPVWIMDRQGQRNERKSVEAVVGEEMTDAQRTELESALEYVDASMTHDEWVSIGMGIHSSYPGPDALSIWDTWSQGCPGLYTEGLCETKWSSFSHGAGGVTIASVFHDARENGWTGISAKAAFQDVPTPGSSYTEQQTEAAAHGNPIAAAQVNLFDQLVYADDMITQPNERLDPILEGVFETGDKFCIIGKSKSKKTFFMLNMAVCIAAGAEHFLGFRITRRRKVMVVQMEVKPSHFKRRVKAVSEGLQVTETRIGKNMATLNLRGQKWTWEGIMDAAVRFGAEVVIFDPVYKLTSGAENAAEDWKHILDMFDQVATKTGGAVVYVHHDAKGKAGDRDIVDRGSGSGILGRDYDAGVTITAHAHMSDAYVLEFVTRNFQEAPPMTTRWEYPVFTADPTVEARAKCSASMDSTPRKLISDRLWRAIAKHYLGQGLVSADKVAKSIQDTAEFLSLPAGDRLCYKTLRDRLTDLVSRDKVVGEGSEAIVFEGRVEEIGSKAVAHMRAVRLGERL